MKISTYIFVTFIFILLLFSITTFINFRLLEDVKANADYSARSTEIIKNSGRFQRNILNMISGLRGYMISGEKYFVQSYDSSVVENDIILKDLSSLITTPAQKELLKEIKTLNDQWVDQYTEPLRDARMLATVNEDNLQQFKKLYRQKLTSGNEKELLALLQQKFKEFSNFEYGIRDERKAILAGSVQRTKNISVILTLSSLVLGLVIVSFLVKRISRRISSMVNMADSIASGNYKTYMEVSGNDELNALAKSLNHMANELASNIDLLKDSNAELDQFAHIVSHDLKGPLRGIDNVISWIEEDKEELSPKVDEYLQIIKGRVRRAENLIQGILEYARTNQEIIPKEELSLKSLIGEVMETLPPRANVSLALPANMPELYTEKLPLFQVFLNLISNAVKYSDKHTAEISIFYEEQPGFYKFYIQDNGPGIAVNHHQKIFKIFQTLKERDSFESTGVGLAIVKKILDARKEIITLDSDLGRGATFAFTWAKTLKYG